MSPRRASSDVRARVVNVPWWRRLLARLRRPGVSLITPRHDAAAMRRREELLVRQARIDDILARPPEEYPHFTEDDRELLRRVRDNLAESISTRRR